MTDPQPPSDTVRLHHPISPPFSDLSIRLSLSIGLPCLLHSQSPCCCLYHSAFPHPYLLPPSGLLGWQLCRAHMLLQPCLASLPVQTLDSWSLSQPPAWPSHSSFMSVFQCYWASCLSSPPGHTVCLYKSPSADLEYLHPATPSPPLPSFVPDNSHSVSEIQLIFSRDPCCHNQTRTRWLSSVPGSLWCTSLF